MTGYQMSNFTSLLRRWKRHGSSRGSNSENKMQISNSRIQEVNDHQSGAQGHAFQVNGHPQQSVDRVDDHHSGAQGHALQVNGHPQQSVDRVDDHHSGAQGHALQVNGHPSQSDDLDNDYEG